MVRISDKSAVRARLLDRGVALLTERGYHGTGLQELLSALGVPKGSFYHYFASKEDFGAAAVGHYIEPYIRRLEQHLAAPDSDALSALRDYFAGLIDDLERQEFKGGCLLGNLLGEIGDTNETCLAALRGALYRYRDLMEQGLVRAQREGTVRADLDAAALADLLADAWQGAMLRMKVEQSAAPLRSCIDHLLDGYFRA